ncbi:MAG TPA: hypothetical protein VJN18_04935 [Polyangiaceae bacterium]|nr:hypothetical protein [Polyangiaceae bacterium]
MISRDEVRRLLEFSNVHAGVVGGLADDAEIHFDSMSLVWFLSSVERELGLAVEAEEVDIGSLTSPTRVHEWLTRLTQARAASTAVARRGVALE